MRIIVIMSILCLSCGSVKKTEAHYEIINEVLNIYSDEFLKNKEKLETTRLNPTFAGLSPIPNYSNLEMLKGMHGYGRKRTYCNNFSVPVFEVDSYTNYYEEQLNPIKKKIDFEKIRGDYIPYKTEIEKPENIKVLKFYENDTTGIPKKVKESAKRQLLHKENGYLEISYPIISNNKEEAVILITSVRVGNELWFLKKVNEKWEKQCYVNIGSIN